MNLLPNLKTMDWMLRELYHTFRLAAPQKNSHEVAHSDGHQHFTSGSDCFIIRFFLFLFFSSKKAPENWKIEIYRSITLNFS